MSVTLAAIEQEVAARLGPFETYTATGGSGSSVVVGELASTVGPGGYEDMWVLRRTAPAGDRQRRVLSYDPTTGTLAVDRGYAVAPAAGEPVELTVVNPSQVLRPAVLRGLGRCYYAERVDVPVTAGAVAQSLSTALFWITDTGQIRDVRSRLGDAAAVLAAPLPWSEVVPGSGGGVDLDVLAPPGGVYVVEALRPYATRVNGVDSQAGPTQDGDLLDCPLAYAAAAGHVEAWRRAQAVLLPIAQAGYAISLQDAAAVFTRQVRAQPWFWDAPDRVRLGSVPVQARTATAVFTTGPTWETTADVTWQGLSALTWEQVLEGVA